MGKTRDLSQVWFCRNYAFSDLCAPVPTKGWNLSFSAHHCEIWFSLAPQVALGSVRPSNPLIAFECVVVLPASMMVLSTLFLDFCAINVLAEFCWNNSLLPLQQSVRWDKFSTWGNKLLAVERGQGGLALGDTGQPASAHGAHGMQPPIGPAFRIKPIKMRRVTQMPKGLFFYEVYNGGGAQPRL